jgi:hypothetical protein
MVHLTAHMWLTVVAGAVILVVAATLLVHAAVHSLQRTRVLYRAHFDDPHRERLFLASLGFFLAVLFVRTLTLAIHFRIGGLHDIAVAGTHVHHLVWGILLLLLVGYLWLAQLGIGAGARWASRLTALLYGVGAALTLDEFALWLHLKDVYWSRQGRESIEVMILFGALLSMGLWGGRFFNAVIRDVVGTGRAR